MSTIDLTTGLARLPEILGDVQFAILYGSAATGTMRDNSDIDVAVMYTSPLTMKELLRLVRDVAAVFRRDVDILDLRTAGPIVKMQVLRYGRPVVINDPGALQRFQMYTPSEYFDFKLQRRPIEEALEAAVLSST